MSNQAPKIAIVFKTNRFAFACHMNSPLLASPSMTPEMYWLAALRCSRAELAHFAGGTGGQKGVHGGRNEASGSYRRGQIHRELETREEPHYNPSS